MKRGIEYIVLLFGILIIYSVPVISLDVFITPDATPGIWESIADGIGNIAQFANPLSYPQIVIENPFMAASMSGMVLPQFIALIPPPLLDPNKVTDKSKLTKAQLEYEDNFNKVKDSSKLNQNTRDEILAERANSNVLSVLPEGACGEVTSVGFTLCKFDQVNIDNLRLTNGVNFEVLN